MEKNPKDYLLYAMGEIVLVVIGILIALAINNGQQKRSLAEKEQIYLKGLQVEFQTSKLKLEELIRVNRKNYLGARQILAFMADPENLPSEEDFSKLLYQSFSFDIAFNPNSSLLTEMINSGSLKDLSNTELRKQLTNWVSVLEDIRGQEDDLAEQRKIVMDMFRNETYSIRTILENATASQQNGLLRGKPSISNLDLLGSTQFENNMLMFYLTSHSTEKSHYDPLAENLNGILDLIGRELTD